MAETLRPPKTPFGNRIHDKWDQARHYIGERRLAVAAVATTATLALIYATDLPNRVAEATASDNDGSDKKAGAPLFPGNAQPAPTTSELDNGPTPSSGVVSDIGNVSLECVGLKVGEAIPGKVWQVTPIVERVLGNEDSPYLYTVHSGFDYIENTDVNNAEQGISPFFFQPGRFYGDPVISIIDTFGTKYPPNHPEFPGMLGYDFPDNQIFPCPTDALADIVEQYSYEVPAS